MKTKACGPKSAAPVVTGRPGLHALRKPGTTAARPCQSARRGQSGRHEIPARLPRRDPGPASGLGGRGAAGEAAQAGAGMGGPVAVQRREDAVVLRQRPEGLLSRLLVRQARRHLPLPDGDGGPELSRRGRATGRRWRACRCRARPARKSSRRRSARVCLDVLAMAARLFEANLQRPVGARARGYLVRPRARLRGAAAVLARLCRPRPLRPARRARRAGRGRRADDRGRPPHPRRGDRRALRPLSRSGRCSRSTTAPAGSIAFGGRAMEPGAKAKYLNSPETPLFHKGSLLFNHHRAREGRARFRRARRRRGLYRRDRDERGGFPQRRRAARHGADRRPVRPPVGDGRASRSSASTATTPAARRRSAPSRRRCR